MCVLCFNKKRDEIHLDNFFLNKFAFKMFQDCVVVLDVNDCKVKIYSLLDESLISGEVSYDRTLQANNRGYKSITTKFNVTPSSALQLYKNM